MAPHLFLNPIADERETPTRVSHRKVVHPAPQDRIDLFNQSVGGLGLVASENNPELAQEGRPFLCFRYPQRHPSSFTTADPAELKAQESEACPLLKVSSADSRTNPVGNRLQRSVPGLASVLPGPPGPGSMESRVDAPC